MQEVSETDGKTYTVQYFERAVFEWHPENQPPFDVLLALLGRFEYQGRYPQGAHEQQPNTSAGSILFQETGKRLGGRFLSYWQTHGGLAQQGFPISDEFEERSALNGKLYRVQYFERAVFEYHPENVDTPFEVLLSQLGTFRYHLKYAAVAPTSVSPTISPAALAYLQEALDYIQHNSIVRDRIDWARVRSEALAMASSAQTTADTYEAIRDVLATLGDNHSRFWTPSETQQREALARNIGLSVSFAERRITAITPGSLAEEAGVRAGDSIEQINAKAVGPMDASTFFDELYRGGAVTLTLRRPGEINVREITISHAWQQPFLIPKGRRLANDVGYITVPSNVGSPFLDEYGSIIQQIIRDLDARAMCGWVVDLQLNGGGAISPMVLGVGPILGEGDAGAFIDANGGRVAWAYRDGAYYYGTEVLRRLDDPYRLKLTMPPVAVLTSSFTASAGEATLISFRGRPQARTFGEPTFGVPTGNSGKQMSDGAIIVLTTALEADRTGRVYGFNERIQPDHYVRVNTNLIGNDNDPVMRAGVDWLLTQPECTR
jgi:C-terminal processing protease CtpA/Prc